MSIREGAWDCASCGKQRNKGSHKCCGACGAPRSPDVEFYLPSDAQVIEDEQELARARSGPDWACGFCGGENPSATKFCTSCGASHDGTPSRKAREYRNSDSETPQKVEPKATAVASGKATNSLKGCLILMAVLALVVVSFFFFTRPQQAELTVKSFSWQRSIETQKFQTQNLEAWEGSVPTDARILSSRREVERVNKVQTGTKAQNRTVERQVQSGTQKVKVGVKDLGNGYFEDIYEQKPVYKTVKETVTEQVPVYRDEPVYRNKIRYEVDRWVASTPVVKSGKDRSPVWPEDIAANDRYRESGRKSIYRVHFEDSEGNAAVYSSSSESEWEAFQVGDRHKAKVNRNGEVVEFIRS